MGLFLSYRMIRPNGEEYETGIVNMGGRPLVQPQEVARLLALKSLHYTVNKTIPLVSWALVHGSVVDALVQSTKLPIPISQEVI